MDPLGELLASDHRRTLEFFVMNLKDVSEPTVDQQELLYNASVLAHYAQISIDPEMPLSRSGRSDRGVRPFRRRHGRAHRSAAAGNRGRAVPAACGIFRGSNAPAAQHSLVCRARRGLSSAGPPLPSSLLRKRNCSTPLEDISSRGAAVMRGSATSCATQPYLISWPRPGPQLTAPSGVASAFEVLSDLLRAVLQRFGERCVERWPLLRRRHDAPAIACSIRYIAAPAVRSMPRPPVPIPSHPDAGLHLHERRIAQQAAHAAHVHHLHGVERADGARVAEIEHSRRTARGAGPS